MRRSFSSSPTYVPSGTPDANDGRGPRSACRALVTMSSLGLLAAGDRSGRDASMATYPGGHPPTWPEQQPSLVAAGRRSAPAMPMQDAAGHGVLGAERRAAKTRDGQGGERWLKLRIEGPPGPCDRPRVLVPAPSAAAMSWRQSAVGGRRSAADCRRQGEEAKKKIDSAVTPFTRQFPPETLSKMIADTQDTSTQKES